MIIIDSKKSLENVKLLKNKEKKGNSEILVSFLASVH